MCYSAIQYVNSIHRNIPHYWLQETDSDNHQQADMFIKQKIVAAITKHPRTATFGIGLAIVIGTGLWGGTGNYIGGCASCLT